MKKIVARLQANNYRLVKRTLIVTGAVAAGVGIALAAKAGVFADKSLGDLVVVEVPEA